VQPRPQLPAAARGGFAKSIDWMFTAFVLFSFMTHFGFVVYLENADWPIEQGIGVIPDQFVDLIFTQEEPPPPEETEQGPTTEETAKPETTKPEKAPSNSENKADKPDKGEKAPGDQGEPSTAEKSARIAEEAAAAAEALLLGALSAEGGGALNDVLAGGAVTGNAEDVLAQASGVGVAQGTQGGTLRTHSGGGGSGKTSGLGGLAAAGGSKQVGEGGALSEKEVRGNIKMEDGDEIGGTGEFDAKLVVAEVRKRLGAIKACYERELRRNPTLQGKVTVQFTIEQSGTISKASATENTTKDDAVASCVVDAVKRFRFNPGPEGGSVVFAYPFVFAPQS
jgi:TonB family protein